MTVTVTCPRCPADQDVQIPTHLVTSVDAALFAAVVAHDLECHLEEIGA